MAKRFVYLVLINETNPSVDYAIDIAAYNNREQAEDHRARLERAWADYVAEKERVRDELGDRLSGPFYSATPGRYDGPHYTMRFESPLAAGYDDDPSAWQDRREFEVVEIPFVCHVDEFLEEHAYGVPD